MLNVFVGGGSVVLPDAFCLFGWLFIPVLLAVGLLMGFTRWIMGFLLDSLDSRADEMGVPRSQRDWGFIGYIAFGKAARLFASCMFFDLAGGALVLMSIVIEQLPFLLPIRHSATAVLSCILAILFCLMPKKAFSWMAVVGMASRLFLVLGLVITGVQLHTLDETATDQVVLDLSRLPGGFGIALLCFLAHSEAPLIYRLMEDRRKWTKVVVYSMTLTEAFLLSFGILGYGFFGSSVAQSIPLLLDATTDLFGDRLVLENAVAFIGDLVGILPANCVCVIFPCIAFLKLHGWNMSRWKCVLGCFA